LETSQTVGVLCFTNFDYKYWSRLVPTKKKIIGSNWFELVPHDLAGADLLDTRADLRQPVTGPARLSRRDVRVACTQV
jgi:hypothetical protein